MTGTSKGGGSAAERAVRWERSRARHQDAVQGLLPWRAARRLRYTCFTPAGPLVRGGTVLALAGYAGWALLGHASRADVLQALGLAVLVVVLATNRASVSDAGLSFDVFGLRQVANFGFIPLWAVQEVSHGPRPANWPRGHSHGGPWPGRRRVHVRYADQHGQDRVRTAWVRDPQRYAEALRSGRPEPGRKPRSRRRRTR